jgi:hypothetical protein
MFGAGTAWNMPNVSSAQDWDNGPVSLTPADGAMA